MSAIAGLQKTIGSKRTATMRVRVLLIKPKTNPPIWGQSFLLFA
jgi:hypothetical protein